MDTPDSCRDSGLVFLFIAVQKGLPLRNEHVEIGNLYDCFFTVSSAWRRLLFPRLLQDYNFNLL